MSKRIATLAGPTLKLDRAKKHLRDLDGMGRWFRESNPYRFAIEDDPDAGKQWLVVTHVEPIPLCIPALAGDVVHNLRSALDQLIRQLIVANGHKAHDKSEFPIGHCEADYRAKKPRKTKGISQTAANFLDALQPYKGGNGEEFFWTIHHLDIVDKHRLLLTTAASHSLVVLGRNIMTRDKNDPEARAESLMPGDELEPRDPPPIRVGSRFEYNESLQVTPLIALSEPGLGERKPLIPTLQKLNEMTALFISACAEGEVWGRHSTTQPGRLNIIPPVKGYM